MFILAASLHSSFPDFVSLTTWVFCSPPDFCPFSVSIPHHCCGPSSGTIVACSFFVNALPSSSTAFVDSSLVHFSFPRLMHLQALSLCHFSGVLVAPQMVCLQLFGRLNFHHCLSCVSASRALGFNMFMFCCALFVPHHSLFLWSLRPSCLLRTGSAHLSVSASSRSFSHTLSLYRFDFRSLHIETVTFGLHTKGEEGSLDLSPPP